ncbi:hypothetical protein F511_42144 [Dorcoceras hygrometricum]|uniref:Uncharacterized protein n=1 Tax=Dorcoceras hygrometricum TaxID=472368 RepID=A0A2Z7CD41_9LAMI|nr:hypothetical protein F511_42144 [Dorcoceras hygrometricum]
MKRRRAEESANGLALMTSSVTWTTSCKHIVTTSWTTRRKQTAHPVSTKNSAEAQSSSRHESAAKQLTTYESLMSTAELNSNGENDKKPAKEKDTSFIYFESSIEEYDCAYMLVAVRLSQKISKLHSAPAEGKMNRKTKQSTAIMLE